MVQLEYSSYHFLDIDVREHVAHVTLNDPERGNAYDRSGHREMSRVMRDLMADTNVHSAVISGAGKAFSLGPRTEPGATTAGPSLDVSTTVAEVREIVYGAIECDKPVACAINGPIRGSALSFALLADVVILERHVKLADTHVLVALTAGDGGVLTWPLAMGILKAKRYLLTGDTVHADDAARLGLVTEVVETGASIARAQVYASRWAKGPQAALRTTKRALNQWLRAGALTAFDMSLALEQQTLQSSEAAAAIEQFMKDGVPAVPRDTEEAN